VRGAERPDHPAVLATLRDQGADAGDPVQREFAELLADDLLSLNFVMWIDAMDARHGLQVGNGLKIENDDVGHGVSLLRKG
jgi:hypothetical protein